ncbi:MAG TPA: twin-arginine translocase TatA/TatE family subunit, partial [Opitutaceae bacterium]|nr:twin-arginine translocase TatA/TatE family subunit [Opitutaceae bacterium]
MIGNPHLAFIEGIGGPELMMVLFVVLMLFGGKKLPELAKGLGKSMREFKKAASGVEEEFKRAIEDAPDTTAS